jgi:hypothetical protein
VVFSELLGSGSSSLLHQDLPLLHAAAAAAAARASAVRAQHGFVLHREIAQYIHEISREEVRKLYLQHNGARLPNTTAFFFIKT